jgi:hypothetical protein
MRCPPWELSIIAPLRRFRRLIFVTLTALSALLFVATAVLWARSYWRADVVGYVGGSGAWVARASSYRGIFRVCVHRDPTWATDQSNHFEYMAVALPTDNSLMGMLAMGVVLGAPLNTHLQFGYVAQRFPSNTTQNWTGQVPDWFIALLSGCLRAHAAFRGRRRRYRLKRGLCVQCGYDLRSTRGHCPECGDVPHARVHA